MTGKNISYRAETMRFYRDILGMKILRHEEFEKGCEAACNGPYDGKYARTVITMKSILQCVVQLEQDHGGVWTRGLTLRCRTHLQLQHQQLQAWQ